MKIFLKIIITILIIAGLIFVARLYNDNKYKKDQGQESPSYYSDPTNISLYPTDIPGVDVNYVDSGQVQGFHLLPENKTHKGLIITFGGSDGTPNFEEASRLAQAGYETLALYFYGRPGQEKTLVKVPLELFEDVLKYLNENISDYKPLTVIGASKGAEYALNLATKYEQIDNLILFAPSAYNFAGLDFSSYGSSWTYRGQELEYIDVRKGSFSVFMKNLVFKAIIKAPIPYKATYQSAIDQDSEKDDKLIPVENTQAKIPLLAGSDDLMWSSQEMAELIKAKKPDADLHVFKDAGHIFSGNGIIDGGSIFLEVGGSKEANEKAGDEAKKIIDEFLNNQHPSIEK